MILRRGSPWLAAVVLAACGSSGATRLAVDASGNSVDVEAGSDGGAAEEGVTGDGGTDDAADATADVGDDSPAEGSGDTGEPADATALDARALDALAISDGAPDDFADADEVPTDSPIVSYRIAQGVGFHACAWRNQDLFCWGQNHVGQLGLGTQSDLEFPTRVTGLGSIRHVAVGEAYTCAVDVGGSVYCWGDNSLHQLGDGTTTGHLVPNLVPGVSGAIMVAAGADHTCALENGGAVLCWGDGYVGTSGDSTRPLSVQSVGDGAEVVAGSFLTCVRRTSGRISCWGPNEYGDVGDGQNIVAPDPVDVVGLGSPAVQVVAGSSHACALLADGSAVCWGLDASGELGDGLGQNSPRPSPLVVPAGETVVAIGGGGASCARLASGRAACWGPNTQGQLGDGTTTQTQSHVPVLVANLTDAADIAGTCAVRASGQALCWGINNYGQVGDGTRVDRYVPTPIMGLAP